MSRSRRVARFGSVAGDANGTIEHTLAAQRLRSADVLDPRLTLATQAGDRQVLEQLDIDVVRRLPHARTAAGTFVVYLGGPTASTGASCMRRLVRRKISGTLLPPFTPKSHA